MSVMWNLWHGCTKVSEGCANCYMYRADAKFGRDSRDVHKTQSYHLPVRRRRNGSYVISSGTTVYTCFTSDFFKETDYGLQGRQISRCQCQQRAPAQLG